MAVASAVDRLQWRGWLLVADCAAVVSIAPWHRTGWSGACFGLVATALLCGPLFAWLLLTRKPRWGLPVGAALLGVLAAVYLTSQVFLAGPVRPPMADWGIPFVVLAGATCFVAGAWQKYAPRSTASVSPPADKDPERRRWRAGFGTAALLATAVFFAWAAYQLALGDGAEPEAKVEPYRAEVLPLPDGWTVLDEEESCGSGGCYGLTLTVTRKRSGADPAGELRRQLHDHGWSKECEPVGGFLRVLGFVDWGGHCVSVEAVNPTTAKIGIHVHAGWPKRQA
ncbi:hypothetical protein [Micromonospora sp. A200]|uniref:hypothetical protein n=1 Tax=Micromonospora sp. A200 TaxID=2940568 RepID=UPI0024733732|nr:hypothetical protein [Micromonospora sp. A200]